MNLNELTSIISTELNWSRIETNYLEKNALLQQVPSVPGIYKIYTNCPIEVLMSLDQRNDSKHYNLSRKINESLRLPSELRINQNGNDNYMIYLGQQHNLKSRFREHFWGGNGTACLNIYEFEELRDYQWCFDYLECARIIPEYEDSKIYRNCIEQVVRVMTGWPILCSQ